MGGCERVHLGMAVYAHHQLRASELSRLRSTARCQHFEQREQLFLIDVSGSSLVREPPPSAEKLTPAPSILHRPASLTTDKSVNFWSLPTGTRNEVVFKAHQIPRYSCILYGFRSDWCPTASSCKLKRNINK